MKVDGVNYGMQDKSNKFNPFHDVYSLLLDTLNFSITYHNAVDIQQYCVKFFNNIDLVTDIIKLQAQHNFAFYLNDNFTVQLCYFNC